MFLVVYCSLQAGHDGAMQAALLGGGGAGQALVQFQFYAQVLLCFETMPQPVGQPVRRPAIGIIAAHLQPGPTGLQNLLQVASQGPLRSAARII